MTRRWIYWLEELGQQHDNLVGKKCANLGEMSKLGMRVPPGFAISVEGFQQYMELTGLGQRLTDHFASVTDDLRTSIQAQMDASSAAKELFAQTPLPQVMARDVDEHYDMLCARCHVDELPVAVRSSGAVSMPGQMDTFLSVHGATEVKRRLLDVWQSTFNTRAIAFRVEKGLRIADAPIGVAVIKMVNATSAGVALTVDPTTGDRDKVIIEGNWGLGESVVSGEITPDRFVVTKSDLSIAMSISRKTRCIVPTVSGTTHAEVPTETQDQPCLTDGEIREMVRIALGIEEHFGVPQDMEWVIDADADLPDSVIWVQTRAAKFLTDRKQADADYLVDQMARLFRR